MAARKAPKSRIRKPIKDIVNELKNWLPNYNHGPNDYPTLLFRILASLPGGDELGPVEFNLGWHEADQLGRVLEAIQDKQDVEDIARELLSDDPEDLEEPVGPPIARENATPPLTQVSARRGPPPSGSVHRSRHGRALPTQRRR
jgi:hypothetical protein